MIAKFWYMMLNIDRTVIVFDLDDTLYKERDYVKSGIEAVLKLLLDTNILTQKTVDTFVVNLDYTAGVIDRLCVQFDFDAKLKDTLIWCYRLHEPHIKLEPETATTLAWANEFAAVIAVITDGRSVTQRLKLRALGLSHIKAFISDDYKKGKPDPEMFLQVEAAWPGCNYVYIADNKAKDFVAPNCLGWSTIGLLNDGRNVERSMGINLNQDSGEYEPAIWIKNISELPRLLSEKLQRKVVEGESIS
jgi:putative hydrolase of the HAD superfamily